MQITFNIQYKTVFGEELLLNIVGREAGDRTIAMSTADGLTWTCQIEAKKSEKPSVEQTTAEISPEQAVE